jgi:hypothetical protein
MHQAIFFKAKHWNICKSALFGTMTNFDGWLHLNPQKVSKVKWKLLKLKEYYSFKKKLYCKMLKNPHFKMTPPPRAMTHGTKICVKMKHKYYSTNLKPNKCIIQTFPKPHNEKYGKCLIWVVFGPPPPGGMTRPWPILMGG